MVLSFAAEGCTDCNISWLLNGAVLWCLDLQPLLDEFEEFSGTISALNEQGAVMFPSNAQPTMWHPTGRRTHRFQFDSSFL